MQAVTWTVATLLITINGYLLMDFFSSEIQGPLSGSLLCVAVVIYASFVLYLILRGTELSEKIVTAIRTSFSWQRLPVLLFYTLTQQASLAIDWRIEGDTTRPSLVTADWILQHTSVQWLHERAIHRCEEPQPCSRCPLHLLNTPCWLFEAGSNT